MGRARRAGVGSPGLRPPGQRGCGVASGREARGSPEARHLPGRSANSPPVPGATVARGLGHPSPCVVSRVEFGAGGPAGELWAGPGGGWSQGHGFQEPGGKEWRCPMERRPPLGQAGVAGRGHWAALLLHGGRVAPRGLSERSTKAAVLRGAQRRLCLFEHPQPQVGADGAGFGAKWGHCHPQGHSLGLSRRECWGQSCERPRTQAGRGGPHPANQEAPLPHPRPARSFSWTRRELAPDPMLEATLAKKRGKARWGGGQAPPLPGPDQGVCRWTLPTCPGALALQPPLRASPVSWAGSLSQSPAHPSRRPPQPLLGPPQPPATPG